MKEIKKKKGVLFFEYTAVFLLFSLMYFFILPQVDVFLFARAIDGSIADTVRYSLYYGNGRLLGNIIGVFFSYHFEFAWIIVSLFLTSLVMLINRLVANSCAYTVFPVAVLVAIPSIDMLGDCYYLFASFCNYVIPIVFVLIAYLIQKTNKENKAVNKILKAVLYAAMLLLFAGGCLFSENTTIVIFCAVILAAINGYIENKKVAFADVTAVVGVALGSFVMLLIPRVTETAYKMDGYRYMSGNIKELIIYVIAGLLKFASIFNHFILLQFVLSIAFIFILKKQKKGSETVKKIQFAVFISYPFACIATQLFDSMAELIWLNIWLNAVNLVIMVVYVITVLYTLLMIETPKIRRVSLMAYVLIIASIAPMMVVNMRGTRTFFTTFITVLLFALWLMKQFTPPDLKKNLIKAKQGISSTCLALTVMLSGMLMMQSVYNFDCYVMRSEYLAQKVDTGEEVSIPMLPCRKISSDENFAVGAYLVLDIESHEYIQMVDMKAWEEYQEFDEKIASRPFHNAVKYALENYEFRNPLYPQQLREKYNSER